MIEITHYHTVLSLLWESLYSQYSLFIQICLPYFLYSNAKCIKMSILLSGLSIYFYWLNSCYGMANVNLKQKLHKVYKDLVKSWLIFVHLLCLIVSALNILYNIIIVSYFLLLIYYSTPAILAQPWLKRQAEWVSIIDFVHLVRANKRRCCTNG